MSVNKIFTIAAVLLAVTPVAHAAETENDKAFYYLGTALSQNLQVFELSDAETAALIKGLREGLAGTAEELDEELYTQKLNQISQERVAAAAQVEKQAAAAYVAEMAAEKGAVTTDSGLVYLEVSAGAGAQPTAASTVTAHYRGTLRDGTVFDSSYDRGQPLQIPLNRVIPCWTEAIAMMNAGGKAKITCPSNIAYGDNATGSIPPGSALTFEVELISIDTAG